MELLNWIRMSPKEYIEFAVFHAVVLFLHVRWAWRRIEMFPEGRPFRFNFLDLLAATLGVTPTVWQFSEAIKALSATSFTPWFLAAATGISQMVGLFSGRIYGILPPQRTNEWYDAFWVLGGALYGLVLLLASFFVYAFAVKLSLYVFRSPLMLAWAILFVIVVYYASRFWRSHW